MKTLQSIILVLTWMSISTASFADGDKVKLKLKLEEGKTYTLEQNIEQHMTQEVMGQMQITNIKMGFTYDYSVVKVTDGIATLKITYKKVYYKMSNPSIGDIEYDSEDKDAEVDEAAKSFSVLVGRSYEADIDENGKVLEVRGIDEMVENMVDVYELEDETKKEQLKEQLGAQFNNDFMKTSIERSMAFYPKKKVGKGDDWVNEYDIKSTFPMHVKNTYTVSKIKKDVVYVDVDATIESDPEEIVTMGENDLKYDMKGTQGGEIEIDIETGLQLSSKISQDISGEVTVINEIYGDITFPMTIKSTVETTFVK